MAFIQRGDEVHGELSSADAHAGAAFTLYDAVAFPEHGSADYLAQIVALLIILSIKFCFSFATLYNLTEQSRRGDLQILARASILRDMSHAFTVNLLPLPVLQAIQERASLPSVSTASSDSNIGGDIVAWQFDPAFVLQSDIVGFTALGSRIPPQALCGCAIGTEFDLIIFMFLYRS